MQAIREIKTIESGKLAIDIPPSFLHKKVEVIVIPFLNIYEKNEDKDFSILSENKFNQIWNNTEDSVYDKFLQ